MGLALGTRTRTRTTSHRYRSAARKTPHRAATMARKFRVGCSCPPPDGTGHGGSARHGCTSRRPSGPGSCVCSYVDSDVRA